MTIGFSFALSISSLDYQSIAAKLEKARLRYCGTDGARLCLAQVDLLLIHSTILNFLHKKVQCGTPGKGTNVVKSLTTIKGLVDLIQAELKSARFATRLQTEQVAVWEGNRQCVWVSRPRQAGRKLLEDPFDKIFARLLASFPLLYRCHSFIRKSTVSSNCLSVLHKASSGDSAKTCHRCCVAVRVTPYRIDHENAKDKVLTYGLGAGTDSDN